MNYKRFTGQMRKKESKTFDTTEEYKRRILEKAYLGKKGYTIPKDSLSKEDLEFLYKDLYCKPVTFGQSSEQAFPVYRENEKKIYLPRFYGIERYGVPRLSEIADGAPIQLAFDKPLRDYQEKIISVYMNHVPDGVGGGILEVPCGFGKTVMALKIISLLKKEALIIVHKEFLMNQWVDRIREFLPEAKIGKIQGATFDVEGKDIVLGMLQSLYDREFPGNAFDTFGLTIIDEVHRIGSEQFSKALLRIVTPCMLGISATVDRKDKLTKVLYMFIGPKIYTQQRTDSDLVTVRAVEFAAADDDFNEVIQDFRGNTLYSSMITKLCAFGPRNDFLVRILADLIKESPEIQVMVLAHNRSLLTYLHDAVCHKGFASVGYYVGGMKQKHLQETEEKQIVLATYAMAAEALDIKTLSVLVMATPKTDITQSIGRILRVKHANPVVVDVVDRHDVFQNQWKQRKTFYRKCNYRIRQISSKVYQGMSLNWDEDKTWTRVFDPKKSVESAESAESSDSESKPYSQRTCLISLDPDLP